MTRARGLTLIELMVALAVFGVLGALSWRAMSLMSTHQAVISTDLQRWRDLGRAVLRIENELLQIAPPVLAAGTGAPPALAWRHAPAGVAHELHLLVVDGGRQAVRRVGFRFVGERLAWVRWPGRLPEGDAAEVVLLDGVREVRWRFFHKGSRVSAWPPEDAPAGPLPQAVELELELADVGTVTRIFALR